MFLGKIKCALFLIVFSAVVSAQTTNQVEGEIILQLFPTASPQQVIAEVNATIQSDLSIIKPVSKRLNIWLLHYDENVMNGDKILSSLYMHPNVANVQFNHFTAQRSLPNDPSFNQQWNMFNDGTTGGINDADIDADLALVPLELARGVQNKVLEAMAMCLPVVLTPSAATGIGAIPGQHLLIAEDDIALAEAVLRLTRDPALAGLIGQQARGFVIETLSWAATLAPLSAMLGLAESEVRHAA